MSYIDFEGFTLGGINGIHSSQLHIIRTSEGSGFSQNPLPSTEDKTANIIGRDGTFFWGRNFKQQTINLPIAYDSMTESNMRDLQKILHTREPISLILDESPYKQYYVIPNQNSKLDYICFATGLSSDAVKIYHASDLPNASTPEANPIYETGRVYKGTGNLQFTVFDPYNRSTEKFIDNAYYNNFRNKNDWNSAIHLINTSGIDTFTFTNNIGTATVYNPGDFAAKPIIRLNLTSVETESAFDITLSYYNTVTDVRTFSITNILLTGNETGIEINNELELIRGYNANGYTNKIYTGQIASGYFIDIPIMDYSNNTPETHNLTISCSRQNGAQITYDYLFR